MKRPAQDFVVCAGADSGTGSARAVALALFTCAAAAGVFPIFESDLFWHLAAGRWMIEHGEIPSVDPFRFTSGAAAWVDHEWLFQLVVHAIERFLGLEGLIAARAVALGLFGTLIFFVARRVGLSVTLAGGVGFVTVLGVRPRFLVRPEIATLFAVVLLLLGVERLVSRLKVRSEGAAPHGVVSATAALVALVVLWVNLHGEALVGPGLVFLYLAGARMESLPGPAVRTPSWGWVFGLPALLAAALLVNPYGYRLLEVPLGIARAMRDLPAANPEWMSAWRAPQPFLFAGMAAFGSVALFARARTGRLPAPAWGLPLLAVSVLSLSAVRHQALFFALGAPYVVACLATFPEARREPRRGNAIRVAAVIVLLGVTTFWAVAPPAQGWLRPRHGGLRWGWGIDASRFPVQVVERLALDPLVGPLYNELVHGGYILWKLHPPRQVFLDGRMELDPGLLHDVAAARRSGLAWSALMARAGAAGALVGFDERLVPVLEPDVAGRVRQVDARSIHSLLFPAPDWRLVDWDDSAMLFLSAAELARGVWSGEPYDHVQPEDPGWTLARAARDERFRAGVLSELGRKLREQPGSVRAARLAAAVRALDAVPADAPPAGSR